MIDIETLGVRPGSVILSLGAVRFDPADSTIPGEGCEFYAVFPVLEALFKGFTVDSETIHWWSLQSEELKKEFIEGSPPPPINFSLLLFSDWFKSGLTSDTRLWAHGATFDVPRLEDYYKRFSMKVPWDFRKVRDTRTLYDIKGFTPEKFDGAHNALTDARHQALAVQNALRKT